MKRFGAITTALVLALLASSSPADHRPDEVVVRFRDNTPAAEQQRFLDENGAHVAGEISSLRVKKLKLPPGLTVEKAIEKMKKHARIELAEPNIIVHKTLLPNDAEYVAGHQWGLDQIGATQAWSRTLSGVNDASIIIAILDTGIYSTHFDLAGKVVAGTNIVTPGGSTEDDEFHGTFVAGIAAATSNNNDSNGVGTCGIAGVAWNAKVMPIKILRADGTGDEFGIVSGLNWAVAHGARVINMSVGSCRSDGTCAPGTQYGAEAMEAAWNMGAILIAATGNEGIRGESYPANYPYVVGVGSTDSTDHRSAFSNYGGMVDLVAPGGNCSLTYATDILSLGISFQDDKIIACGTSASAPFVSGLAAVILGQNPGLSNADVVRIMESSADPIGGLGWNELTGYGRINMYRALSGGINQPPTDSISAYNYPNPFSPRLDRGTAFVVRNLQGRSLSLEIRDMLGNILWTKKYTAGEAAHLDLYFNSQLRWDGTDSGGRTVPNGVYFATIKAGSSSTVVKVAVIH